MTAFPFAVRYLPVWPSAASALVRIGAVLAIGAAAPSLLADTSNFARVMVTPNAAGDFPTDTREQHVGVCSASTSGAGGYNSSGSGTASVTYGTISLSGVASGSLTTFLSGTSRDSITVNAPGVPAGTPGRLTFTVEVAGELSATAGGSITGWRLNAGLGANGTGAWGGPTDITRSGERYGPATPVPGYQGAAFGAYSATIDFQFGAPAPLFLELVANARASYSDLNTPGAASVGNPLTARWLGISAVTVGGAPVSSFTVTSESGTSYAGIAVPPSTPACAADFGSAGGEPTPDGTLSNDDFIAFISCFFNQEARADIGQSGGLAGGDGMFNNDDFVVFITRFFAGC